MAAQEHIEHYEKQGAIGEINRVYRALHGHDLVSVVL